MAEIEDGVCAASPPAIGPHPETGRPSLIGTDHEVADVARALESESPEVVARRLGLSARQLAVVEATVDRLGP
jgi:hypothetical protein